MNYLNLMAQSDMSQICAFRNEKYGVCGFLVVRERAAVLDKGLLFISDKKDEASLIAEALSHTQYKGALVISPLEGFSSKRKEAFMYVGALLNSMNPFKAIPGEGILEQDIYVMSGMTKNIVVEDLKTVPKIEVPPPESRI